MLLELAGSNPTPWCPGCGGMMGGGGMWGYGLMGAWVLIAFLIAVAVLVLLVVAIVRLWPGRETFSSAAPRRLERPPEERQDR